MDNFLSAEETQRSWWTRRNVLVVFGSIVILLSIRYNAQSTSDVLSTMKSDYLEQSRTDNAMDVKLSPEGLIVSPGTANGDGNATETSPGETDEMAPTQGNSTTKLSDNLMDPQIPPATNNSSYNAEAKEPPMTADSDDASVNRSLTTPFILKNENLLPPLDLPPMSSSSSNSSTNISATDFVTIVVQLSGELGNQLQKLANGRCVQHHIEQQLGLKTRIMLRTQKHPKWKRAMASTQEAFPQTRLLNFREGNTGEFDAVHKLQVKWVKELFTSNQLTKVQNPTMLNEIRNCIQEQCYTDLLNLLNQTWHMKDRPHGSASISIPHVYVDEFVDMYCWELMYDDFKEFFQIDEKAICNQVPDPDESVFHLRNFIREMPRVGKRLGFEEADANMTASQLFADYKPGDKVAILSRFPDNTKNYIQALNERGIEARYIQNQTGNQDFCFLLKTQKEIVGSRRSSFSEWAGYLGDAKSVRLYSLSTDGTRGRGVDHFYHSFENPKLKGRIFYENYNVTKDHRTSLPQEQTQEK